MNEEEKRLFDEDMEKYGITFEEWIIKMEEIAEEVEREQQELINQNTRIEIEEGKAIKMSKNIEDYYIKSQQESIAKFKKRHPNGAKIDINATLNINNSMEEIMEVVDELTEGVEVLEDFKIDDYKYEEPFIILTKEDLEELVPSIKTENSINIFNSEDNNINKRNFYMLKEFVKSIKGE